MAKASFEPTSNKSTKSTKPNNPGFVTNKRQKNKSTSLFKSRYIQLIGFITIAVLGFIFKDVLSGFFTRTPTKVFILPPQPIPRIAWTHNEPFAAKFIVSRMPVVLEGTAVASWPALQKWTPDYLAENVAILEGTYTHQQKVFTFYDPGKPFGQLATILKDLQASHKIVNITAATFFEKAQKALKGEFQEGDNYYYYSGPLDSFPESVQNDISPHLDWLVSGEGPQQTVNVFMGYNGTTAHTHYDIFHNFNVQISGTKRFVLYPPSQWTKLYHYPRLHPSYRQSQVDFDSPNATKFPLFENVESFEVIMKPGDMLYVPPYWSHRPVSLDLSISVNVFSDSKELGLFYDIQKNSLDWIRPYTRSLEEAVYALREFVFVIAQQIMPEEKVPRFMELLYETRYRNIYEVVSSESTMDFIAACSPTVPKKPMISAALRPSAKNAAELFRKMPKDIDLISFGNFIEEVSRALFKHENVAKFIKQCLVPHTKSRF